MDRPILPLTSLRFFAAAMILIHHGATFGLPTQSLRFGQGVSFFFVLSGFILTYRYPELSAWRDVRRFLILRIARIWPAHAVTTIAALVVFGQAVDFKLIAHLSMVHAWVPSLPWYFGYNSPSWSISTEFFFYLLFPILITDWSRTYWRKLALCAVFLLGLMVVCRELGLEAVTSADTPTLHGMLYISPLARLLEFMAGMAACAVFRRTAPRLAAAPVWMFTIAEIASIVLVGVALETGCLYWITIPLLPSTAEHYLGPADSWPAFTFLIFVFAFQRGAVAQFLSLKPLLLLGDASYSLYLVHAIVFGVTSNLVTGIPGFAVGCAASVVLALVLWRWVERPGRHWGRVIADAGMRTGEVRGLK